jgi:tetratricopeptide (TPR) repeat protein
MGRERYQAAIASVVAAKPAYDAYDRGRSALAQNRLDEAERLAAQAIEALPGEGQFYSLQGDIDAARNRHSAAIEHYSQAIAHNDQYFYPYLQRGLSQQRLGQNTAAEASLQASIDLLPTADAYYALGTIAEQRGDRARALAHYEQAAGANTPASRAAQDAAVRLDLPDNPGKYLRVRTALDADGSLVIELANPTRIVVTDVVLMIRYAEGGSVRQLRRVWPGRIEAGAAQQLDTGIGPLTADGYQVEIQSARAQAPN